MSTPRIEEAIEEVASVCDEVEFLHGVPVKLPSQTKALLRGKVREALTEARQAGYADGYKQGKFDAEVTAEYGEPKDTLQDNK